jgi:hypothetical protein
VIERRQFSRADILKAGQVLCAPLRVPCSLRNVSATGMSLRLLIAVRLPEIVEVLPALEDAPLAMRVRWCSGADVGLQFLGDVRFEPMIAETPLASLALRSLEATDEPLPPVATIDDFGSRAADLMNRTLRSLRASR